ncbi:MAG: ATPase [Rhodopirellula sp.]|nr:ATPase [Rhodopirellula sp.]
MNWFEPSGTISFQGKQKGKSLLESKVPELISTNEKSNGLQERIHKLVEAVSDGMFEREEIIAVSLLGALCGQNTFLFGPPGTAKSLISRRIACAFQRPTYFEYLMNRFSTPEEVFGPVSIKALKEDQYTRKTEAYLPKAEFAFLDEIWKSSPAILNTLLTLINERIFRNGEVVEPTPLKALIAASNETPEANQGLEALYDRFIIRLLVGPISQSDHFDRLLKSKPTEANVAIPEDLVVTPDEWVEWRQQLHNVHLSSETLTIIHLIRAALAEKSDELDVYVSDRRWQRAAMLMKASAYFNGREETNHSDAVLLKHCLWTHEDNRQAVIRVVEDAIKEAGFESGVDLAGMNRRKEDLEKEIKHELFHTTDVYETKRINDHEYFFFRAELEMAYSTNKESREIYIPCEKLKSTEKFHPLDERGNEEEDLWCEFDGQGTCQLSLDEDFHYRYDPQAVECTPKILFHKGDKKQDINKRLVNSLLEAVSDLKADLEETRGQVEKKLIGYQQALSSPFISQADIQLVLSGITAQIDRLKLRVKDCERLEALCH